MQARFGHEQSVGRWLAAAAVLALGVAAVAPGGFSDASAKEKIKYMEGREAITPDGLHRVQFWEDENGAAWVKPGAEIKSYSQLILDAVSVAYKRPPHRNQMNDIDNGNYALSPEAMKDIEKYFRKAFAKELEKGKTYTMVEAPAPDALQMVSQIVNLTVNVPSFQDQAPDETVFTRSAGSFTMIIDLRDSQSRDPLVRLAHFVELDNDQAVGFRQSNPVVNSGLVRDAFDNEARILRDMLDRLRELPEIPEAPNSGDAH